MTNHRTGKPLSRCCTILAGASIAFSLNSQDASAQQAGTNLDVRPSRVTGLASVVTARGGGPMIVQRAAGRLPVNPMDFWAEHGGLFGVADPAKQLRLTKSEGDAIGHSHFTYEQVHDGIVVFSGVLKAHSDAAGNIVAANGDYYPIPAGFNTKPAIDSTAAAGIALKLFDGVGGATVQQVDLVIVDPAWYGDPPAGVHLAWYIVVTDVQAGVVEALFVDALTGKILDRWSLIHTARFREIHDAAGSPSLPGPIARIENDPPAGDFDTDAAYDYYGDTYDYYFRAFGRDGIDDAGLTMIATVDSTAFNCPNAFWNGDQMVFCAGLVTDDVVGHELTHGVTQYTAGLIYQNQSGQLNESFSDVFGEMIDLFNGNAAFAGPPGGTPWPPHPPTGPGNDTPNGLRTTSCSDEPGYPDGVRWLIGENINSPPQLVGPIRDMWNPPCFGDPDYANSPLQTCNPLDNGGVHSGSGVPNHAFAMLVDGKTFNSRTISPIGPIKAGAVWYRTLSVYLTPASDFNDAYPLFNLAAADLVGTFPNDPRTGAASGSMFTAADAVEVDETLLAVEMNTFGACGGDVLDSDPPTYCSTRTAVYSDGFEGGVNGWTVTNSSPPTPYNWVQVSGLPYGRPGTAWFCADPSIGNCAGAPNEAGRHTLFSPMIVLPSPLINPGLTFTHYVDVESGYDGGNVSVRIDGGGWLLVPSTDFDYNPYNATLFGGGNTNPLAGQPAWSGVAEQWGTSVIDLSGYVTGGETLEVRFDFGKNRCLGVDGWYVDDLEFFHCPPCAEEQKLTAADAAANAWFGASVSVSEDAAVVGARFDDGAGFDSGSAYVYVRSGGVWTQQQKLIASDAGAFDRFGISVSVSGSTAVIGATHDDDAGSASGSAYVFVRSGEVWFQQQKLTASDAAANDQFGRFVSVSGDTAVVGADLYDHTGSAYVYVRSGGVWTQQQKLTASDATPGDLFGVSVEVNGDTAVIGAFADDDAGSVSGSAYVFVRSGGVWTEQQKLTASDAAAGDEFGYSVSVSGDTAVVGAFLDDGVGSNSGSAYVFVRAGGTWMQQQKLTASDAAADDSFGESVSVSGNTVVIGAQFDDDAGNASGSAYLYVPSGGVWTQQRKLTALDGASGNRFGKSVSVDGDAVVVGAFGANNGSGSAYVFSCPPPPSLVRINEVEYDQPGTDFDEFIELHGPGGMDLTGWTVELVDGAGGLVYTTIPLTSIPSNGYLVIDGGTFAASGNLLEAGSENIQNGAPDGIALCDNGVLVEMISYEGVTMATSGCASGMSMPDVGVADGGNAGESLTRSDTGSFVLQPSTPGAENGVPVCSPPDCNSHGTCDDGTCICDTGYAGPACNQCGPNYYHYPTCTFCLAAATCSGNGTCNVVGGCACNAGFAGAACDQCAPDYYNYPTCTFCVAGFTCFGHSTCNGLGGCDCNAGFVGAACDQCAPNHYNYPTCTFCLAATTCSGNGTCNASGGCNCNTGFAGAACDQCAPGYVNYPNCTALLPPGSGDDLCVGGTTPGAPCSQNSECPGTNALCGMKNRYISITPGNAGQQTVVQVTALTLPASLSAFVGDTWYLDAPAVVNENPSPGPTMKAATLLCNSANTRDWGGEGLVHITGAIIVPGATYEVRQCTAVGGICSNPLVVGTNKHGDVVAPLVTLQPNFGDIAAMVDKFQAKPGAISKSRAQMQPNVPNPNNNVNFLDISVVVGAFQGASYGFPAAACP